MAIMSKAGEGKTLLAHKGGDILPKAKLGWSARGAMLERLAWISFEYRTPGQPPQF
jgi:hypothetical protein